MSSEQQPQVLRLAVDVTVRLEGSLNVRHFMVRQLASPGALSITFLRGDNEIMAQNGYKITAANVDPNATTRIVTVDFGSGVPTLQFAPSVPIKISVPQDAHVVVTLHDTSTNPAFSDSPTVTVEFDATERNPPVVTPLASPGDLTVEFTGEE